MAELIGQHILHLDCTASTNNYAIDLIKKNKIKEGTIVWTDEQTAGKGQLNNKWASNANENLTFSVVLFPSFVDITGIFSLSEFVSLAIYDFLISVGIKNVSIKWPNDIYVGDKKIAGILIENSLKGKNIKTAIIGIGLNVNQTIFPNWVPNPISMKQVTGDDYLLKRCLESISLHMNHRFEQLQNGELANLHLDYLKTLYKLNEVSKFKAEEVKFTATITDVLPSGKLQLTLQNGEKHLFEFKEVEYVI